MSGNTTKSEDTATNAFSNLQWYMYHQRNVAFFAAFSSRVIDPSELPGIAQSLMELAPQLKTGFANAESGRDVSPSVTEKVLHHELVRDFEGFPDKWLDAGAEINARPDLPLFRIRVAARADGPDARGRGSFVLVQVSHALVEGADSALLSRSRSASRTENLSLPLRGHSLKPPSQAPKAGYAAWAGKMLGGPAAIGHLLAAGFYQYRPGPYAFATHTLGRQAIAAVAKHLQVRQRALLFALGLMGIFGTKDLSFRKRLTSTYSTIDSGAEAQSSGFMRMRMLFAAFPVSSDLQKLAHHIDETLKHSETREAGFNQALNMSALGAHRWLHKKAPFLYRRQVFNFMPYDAVLGLIPPHRLDGALTNHLIEPVYAGAALEGANACVIVPGRQKISFNFYVQTKQLSFAGEMAALLENISPAPR